MITRFISLLTFIYTYDKKNTNPMYRSAGIRSRSSNVVRTIMVLCLCATTSMLFTNLIVVTNGFTIGTRTAGIQNNAISRTIFHKSSKTTTPSKITSTSLNLGITTAESKFFQLEEMEDKETCTTELFLSNDGSVTVGDSNGPPPIAASGRWEQFPAKEEGTKTFRMTISRTFGGGRPGTEGTDMGEFTFQVERLFTGVISSAGESASVAGTIHALDDLMGDLEVGYFSMIDTTNSKLDGEDEKEKMGMKRSI